MNQLHPNFGQPNAPLGRPESSRMSVLGIIFFIMGAPNLYAFLQRRAEMAADNSGGMPRYAVVALVAMAIAGLYELSIII